MPRYYQRRGTVYPNLDPIGGCTSCSEVFSIQVKLDDAVWMQHRIKNFDLVTFDKILFSQSIIWFELKIKSRELKLKPQPAAFFDLLNVFKSEGLDINFLLYRSSQSKVKLELIFRLILNEGNVWLLMLKIARLYLMHFPQKRSWIISFNKWDPYSR